MGMFDRLLKRGLRAVENAVGDVITETITDTIKGALGDSDQSVKTSSTRTQTRTTSTSSPKTTTATSYVEEDERSFDEKLTTVINSIGNYEIRKNISPDVLEQEAGKEIYVRGGCYALPQNLTYAIYKDGKRVLFINLWEFYTDYKRLANRKIKEHCDKNGIILLEFFDYMPNEVTYMEDRIRKALA